PWGAIGGGAGALLGALLVAAYAVKGVRRARGSSHRLVYRGVLDRLSDLGEAGRFCETRERHAARVAALSPPLAPPTPEHPPPAPGARPRGRGQGGPAARARPGARDARRAQTEGLVLRPRVGGAQPDRLDVHEIGAVMIESPQISNLDDVRAVAARIRAHMRD